MTRHRKLVAVDFDGTLHAYNTPWTNAETISDGPTPSAMTFLKNLADDPRFEVVVVSSRCSCPLAVERIEAWLLRHLQDAFGERDGHDIFSSGLRVMQSDEGKLPAHILIDDRAFRFEGRWPSLDELADFKPWNKLPAPEPTRIRLPYEHHLNDDGKTGSIRMIDGTVVLDPYDILDAASDILRPENADSFLGADRSGYGIDPKRDRKMTLDEPVPVLAMTAAARAKADADFLAGLLRVLVGPHPEDPDFTWLTAMLSTIEGLEGAGQEAWDGEDPLSAHECLKSCRRMVDGLREVLRPQLERMAAEAEGRSA